MFRVVTLGTLVLVAAIIALASAKIHPNRPNWAEDTLLQGEVRLAALLATSTEILWIDARSEGDYTNGHIPEAVLLNEDDWDGLLPEILSIWQPGQQIVVYCSSQKCQSSHSVAERLRNEVGMDEVYVLKGGWEAWQAVH